MANWNNATIDWYAQTHGEDPTTRATVDAAPFCASDDILDIGCGTGASLRHLEAAGVTGRLVGVDPFARMIGHAERRSSARIEYLAAPAEELPFDDAAFSGVLAVNSVAHWQDLRVGLTEASRVLRSGGWIALGGEVFSGEDILPQVESELRRAGYVGIRRTEIEGGAVVMAHKGDT